MLKLTSEQRTKLEQKLNPNNYPWLLSKFGEAWDIDGLEMEDYQHFLDNINSLEDLLKGLNELSPFTDDALNVAENMHYLDFVEFKLSLPHMRHGQEDYMVPEKYRTLVLPKMFISALFLADEAQVPLGATLIRLAQIS